MLYGFGAAKEDLFKIAKKNILEKYPFSLFPMSFVFYGIVDYVCNKEKEKLYVTVTIFRFENDEEATS